MFYSNVNKIFLGTDGAASSRVSQILPLRVEGSIPYSAPLNICQFGAMDRWKYVVKCESCGGFCVVPKRTNGQCGGSIHLNKLSSDNCS